MDDNLGPRKTRKKTEKKKELPNENSEKLDVSNQTPTQPKANSISSNGEPSKISGDTPISSNGAENDDNLGKRKPQKNTENEQKLPTEDSEILNVLNQTPTQTKANSISSNGEPSKISEDPPISSNGAENDDNLGKRKPKKNTENKKKLPTEDSENLNVSNQTQTQAKANSFSSNGEPSKISENTPISSTGAENSADGINQFHFGRGTWITTTDKVKVPQIQKYIENQVALKRFPANSNLTVFCGHHGVKDKDQIRMGNEDSSFTFNLHTALKDVEEKYEDIINEKGYDLSGLPRLIYLLPKKGIKESCRKDVYREIESLIKPGPEKPNIILFASCFSKYGDFKEFVLESGLCSVVLLRNERGSITKGKCFQLDETQAKLIELLMTDHWQAESPDDLKLRNLILTGRFGTGKTLVITEGTWMRINFCLRKIREYGK